MSDSTAGLTRREALKRGITIGGAAMVWAVPTTQAFGMTTTVAQGASGGAGCTPGYWKNHVEVWEGTVSPGSNLGSIFGINPAETNCETVLTYFSGKSILEALHFQGGDDLYGKYEIFFRAAAAAYLNSRFVADFPYTGSELDIVIIDAIKSCDESQIVRAGNLLDVANNIGCPFDNQVLTPSG